MYETTEINIVFKCDSSPLGSLLSSRGAGAGQWGGMCSHVRAGSLTSSKSPLLPSWGFFPSPTVPREIL